MAEAFMGEIRMFAANFAPRAWGLCQGQSLAIASNQALFSLLGTTYGGDGRSTFALPDLRGRVPLQQGDGPGLTNRPLGSRGGTETVTLALNQIPQHTHSRMASQDVADSDDPTGRVTATLPAGDRFYELAADADKLTEAPEAMIGNAGGSQPHPNMMPILAMNFIMCLQGSYPSRN